MTVSYQYEVASSTSGGFTRLLLMWRGSLYKLIYRELVLFLALFLGISFVYRNLMTPGQRKDFEVAVAFCDSWIEHIPLSFVLGFYVTTVAGRWWDQYTAIPWPDKVMHLVALYVLGEDEYGRTVRRSLMRYLNLSLILVLRSISSAVKRRFPTLDHVVESGFMTGLELELFQSVPSIEFNTYWIPCTWFINLLKEARANHRITDSQGLKIIMEEFNDFRAKCGMLWSYDWVSIPLVYTQVVTLATYTFFAIALIGRQYISDANSQSRPLQTGLDKVFPVLTVLQFFFYMGLLKVAEQLINPFGDDDEDFELNWLIDRHTKVSYLGVDTLMGRCPPLVKDIYYDSENLILPYTEAAAAYKRKTYRGSVANMMVPEEKYGMFLPEITEEDVGAEGPPMTATPRTPSTVNLMTMSGEGPAVKLSQQPAKGRAASGDASPMAMQTAGGPHYRWPPPVSPDFDDDDEDQQQPPQQSAASAGERGPSGLVEAVRRKFAKRSALSGIIGRAGHQQQYPHAADQTNNINSNNINATLARRPLLSKPVKIGIEPWPSATNLQFDEPASTPSRSADLLRLRVDIPRIPATGAIVLTPDDGDSQRCLGASSRRGVPSEKSRPGYRRLNSFPKLPAGNQEYPRREVSPERAPGDGRGLAIGLSARDEHLQDPEDQRRKQQQLESRTSMGISLSTPELTIADVDAVPRQQQQQGDTDITLDDDQDPAAARRRDDRPS